MKGFDEFDDLLEDSDSKNKPTKKWNDIAGSKLKGSVLDDLDDDLEDNNWPLAKKRPNTGAPKLNKQSLSKVQDDNDEWGEITAPKAKPGGMALNSGRRSNYSRKDEEDEFDAFLDNVAGAEKKPKPAVAPKSAGVQRSTGLAANANKSGSGFEDDLGGDDDGWGAVATQKKSSYGRGSQKTAQEEDDFDALLGGMEQKKGI
jgi:hypothetical protein